MKNLNSILSSVVFAALLLPALAFAQVGPSVVPDYPSNITGVPVPALGVPGIGNGIWGNLLNMILIPGPAGAPTATWLILSIINVILWVVGFLAVLFVIIGGIRYITAHGNEEQAELAKKTITQAIIGIIVVVLSFVIIRVIVNALILGSAGA